jgi:hypothetical protein
MVIAEQSSHILIRPGYRKHCSVNYIIENMLIQEQLNVSTQFTQEQLRFIHAVYFSIWTNTPDFHTLHQTITEVFVLCPLYNFIPFMISIPQRIQVPNLITVLFVKYFINFSQWVTYIIHASSPKQFPASLNPQHTLTCAVWLSSVIKS